MLDTGYVLKTTEYEYTVLEVIGRGANTVAYLAERRHADLTSKCILKEYSPHDTGKLTDEEYEKGKARFIASGRLQNSIRNLSELNNQTPPICHIFEYVPEVEASNEDDDQDHSADNSLHGTAFIDVSCYNGTTLNKLKELSLPEYLEIIRTIAKTVGYYHKAGYLCLDVKPENVFVMQNTPEDTITQLVEFIDFDSIRKIDEMGSDTIISCTKGWAAPEQLNLYSAKSISPRTDIYAIGELIFYYIFGRHSDDNEHRGFSKYPFGEVRREYRKYTNRPDIQSILFRLFRGTIRSSASNRFCDMADVVSLLDRLIDAVCKKDYVIPKLPYVSPDFLGRDAEIREISDSLKENNILFITGVGGIGKSALIRNYIVRYRSEYDALAYIEYDGDIIRSFADDKQLQISTVVKSEDETIEEYYERKFRIFRDICADKKVLLVIDNYSGPISKELSNILESGFYTVVVTRNEPPKNSFSYIRVDALSDISDLYSLISLNLDRRISDAERVAFDEIICLTQGHTLTLELIARQIAAGRIDISQALLLIRENGFSGFSNRKISNFKDGEEVYGTLSAIISALFTAGNMDAHTSFVLKILSFLEVRGIERELVQDILKLDSDTIDKLAKEGWLYADNMIHLHPVIAETVRSWSWGDIKDITVMDSLKKVIDVYVGSWNIDQIKIILKEAVNYNEHNSRHIIRAMYYDILGCYYDVLSDGNYSIYQTDDSDPIDKMIEAIDMSIKELEQSSDIHRNLYLPKYYMNLAGVLIRCVANCKNEVCELLGKARKLTETCDKSFDDYEHINQENLCYINMISAWYYTIIEPDTEKMLYHTDTAKDIAYKTFSTELEIIDIVYIPTANCLAEFYELSSAAIKLEEAVTICRKYPDMIRYIDKQAELLRILADLYFQKHDTVNLSETIMKLEYINETYRAQGVYKEIPEEYQIICSNISKH